MTAQTSTSGTTVCTNANFLRSMRTSCQYFVTNDNKLTVEGTYSNLSGNTIQISNDGGATWVTVTNVGGGNWSYSDPATHSDGTFTYQVRAIDIAGSNRSLREAEHFLIWVSQRLQKA